MNKLKQTLYGIIALLLLVPQQILAASFHAAIFNPQSEDDPFWQPVTRFMAAAAKDLDIKLEIHVADHDRLLMIEQARKVVTRTDPPQVILFKNFKDNAADILRLAEDAGVKAFIFNAGLSNSDLKKLGKPRENFSYWIGQMLPDDEQAGYDLANLLFERARMLNKAPNERISFVALTGNLSDSAAIERNKGLHKAIMDNPDTKLEQLVPARWSHDQAYQKARGLFKRYPHANLVWAANDPMALGAVKACQSLERNIANQCITGGIDWNPPALEAIQNGEMVASIGGHFMEGGWVLVLLYDYFKGLDFANHEGTMLNSEMGILHKQNIDTYIRQFSNEDWGRIDFRSFSKHLNPQIERYDFSLKKVLEQL